MNRYRMTCHGRFRPVELELSKKTYPAVADCWHALAGMLQDGSSTGGQTVEILRGVIGPMTRTPNLHQVTSITIYGLTFSVEESG
jgi:hypothetical protein